MLEQAELWGKLNVNELSAIRTSRLSNDANIEVLSTFDKQGIPMEKMHCIDSTLGLAGDCEYWIALALSIEHVKETGGKELVLGPKDQRFNATVIASVNIDEDGYYNEKNAIWLDVILTCHCS